MPYEIILELSHCIKPDKKFFYDSSTKNILLLAAKHNWDGKVKYGLELMFGDRIEIIEECSNWYRGFKVEKPDVIGIFPKSYVHLKDVADPFRSECCQVLKEWLRVCKQKFAVSI